MKQPMLAALLCAVLPVFAASAATAPAADGASDAQVRELLDLMQSKRLIDESIGQMDSVMRDSMNQALAGKTLSPDQQKIMDDMQGQIMSLFKDNLRWESLEPDLVKIYRDNFSAAEIAGMLRFYHTPTGQAVIAKLPAVTQQSSQAMFARMKTLMPKMMDIERDAIQKMQAAGAPPPPPAADTPPPAADTPAH